MEKKFPTFHVTPWPAMLRFEPDRLRAILVGKIAEHHGAIHLIAQDMGLRERSVYNYLGELGLVADAQKARDARVQQIFRDAKTRSAERKKRAG